ncbi:neurochondrin-like [Amphiura filiformis]|uniref:neurochondrin-like n=1 Tax=Amphiura filiformis TaxID=82378 RepID=UPI003B20FE54
MATIRELPSEEVDTADIEGTIPRSDEDKAKAVDKCLQVLSRAKTDTEIFAALLLVTKLVQAEDTDAASRRKIFNGVGFTFLNRLIKTDKVPEGCDSSMYQSLAVTLLACFSTDPHLVTHPQMLNKIPVLKDIILSARTSVENVEKKSLIEDSFQILVAMATQDLGSKQLIGDGMVPALCDVYNNSYFGNEQAFSLLGILIEYCGEEIWETNRACLNELLSSMASEFKQIQDERKFKLCTRLTLLLTSSNELVPGENAVWAWDIHHGLSDILKSKTGQSQRNPALKLASFMMCQLGVSWALGPQGSDKKLLLLIINLACVEVRMGLEDSSQNVSNRDILPACYSVLESCIEFMTCGPSLSLDEKQVLQLHNAMTGAFGAVLFFLKENQFEPEKVDDPLVRATVRVLSVWLAEETAALRNQVYDVLPFVLSVIEKSFEEAKLSSDLKEARNHTTVAQYPLFKSSSASTDLLRLMLPALCHLTADQEPRELLIMQGAMETCGKYFSYQWKQFEDKQGDQPEVALITLCNIFLNVSLQDTEAVKKAEVFTELYGLVANVLPKLGKQHENLVLSFNMAVLGLTLMKNLSNSASILDLSESKRFVGAVLQMFGNSHQCGKSGQCEIAPTYQQHWEDITELWMLGMQLLSECVGVFPWFAGLFLQYDWMTTTVKLLTNVAGGGLDEETCTMYGVVLSSLCKHLSDVHSQLNQANGLELARKHNMLDLAVVLQTPPLDGPR